jgi:hypothetical protein
MTSKAVTVLELFKSAGLKPSPSSSWDSIPEIEETRNGVYVIARTKLASSPGAKKKVTLPSAERSKWLEDQPVIYIGQTKRALKVRLKEFHRHKRGNHAPHRGGQNCHLIKNKMPLWVYFTATPNGKIAKDFERRMIEYFRDKADSLPYANRRR